MKQKRKIGFSVLDVVLFILAAVCVVSTVFQSQIRAFLGRGEGKVVEITFLVENVTEEAHNHPSAGEEMVFSPSNLYFGKLLSIAESKTVYQNQEDVNDWIEVLTLTCKMEAKAKETDLGYTVAGFSVKPGSVLTVETPTASFAMTVTMIKSAD